MNEEEIKSIKDIMLEVANVQAESSYKNSELSRRERIKERLAYLLNKYEWLTKEEMDELSYCKYLVDKYYVENPII